MLEKIKLAIKQTFSIKNLQNGIRNAFSKKNLIRHFIDAAIAVLILFTFFGEPIVGFNLPIIYFVIAIGIYLTCVIYKWICHLQDLYEEEKKKLGINNKKTRRK